LLNASIKNLNALRAAKEVSLPVQVVPAHAKLEEAIDISTASNSQGTKLTDAELALTHVTAKWPQARRVLKEKMSFCEERDFDFKPHVHDTISCGYCHGSRALRAYPFASLCRSAGGLEALEQCDRLSHEHPPKSAQIHGTDDLNTTNALIPLIAYLARSKACFQLRNPQTTQ